MYLVELAVSCALGMCLVPKCLVFFCSPSVCLRLCNVILQMVFLGPVFDMQDFVEVSIIRLHLSLGLVKVNMQYASSQSL